VVAAMMPALVATSSTMRRILLIMSGFLPTLEGPSAARRLS
jgi:hypothetical protein